MAKKENRHAELVSASANIEAPYELPEGWKWVRIGDIAEIINGKNQRDVEDENGVYPIYGSGGIIGKAKKFICPENCTIIGRKGTINNPIFVETKFWNVDTAFGMKTFDCVNPKFYFYFCKSYNFTTLDSSTAIPSLTKTNIQQIPFPLPSTLIEQQHIVNRIETMFAKLDQAQEKAQAVLDSFETRKAAILHKAFTGELTANWRKENGVPDDSWEEKSFGEITENHDSERIPLSQKQRENMERIYDYYGATGVIDKVDKYIFNGKYLLIGEDGANLLSRSKPQAFIAEGKYWVNNHAHIVSAKSVDIEFLCLAFNSIDLTPYVSGSAQPKLTQAKMNEICITVPSLPEQQEIVRILDTVLEKESRAKEAAQTVLDQIALLKKSILARAFRGEL